MNGPVMNGKLVRRDHLSASERARMYALLERHFDGVGPARFHRDLAEKNWAILVEDEAGDLRGFSTLLVYAEQCGGRRVGVACSGDTIMDPGAWGSRVLLRTWLDAVLKLGRSFEPDEFYWLLISSGYRTYRFLPVFWREFYPRHDVPTPPYMQLLLDSLASRRWGGCYNPASGIVRFPQPQVLRPWVSPVTGTRQSDSHVAFFLERNPGHSRGDEMVCLTRIAAENLSPAGRRILRSVPAAAPRREEIA